MYKIYKLIFNGCVVYIGQTKLSLKRRKGSGYGKYVPFYRECEIELIEETNDVSRERYWIEYYLSQGCPLLNILKGDGLDPNEARRNFIDRNKDYFKNYSENYSKKYYEENKEKIILKSKKYYEENIEKRRLYNKKYYEENKEIIDVKSKEYNEKNKEKLKEYRRKYYREYYWRKKEELSVQK